MNNLLKAEFNDNETVTISLERYERLKQYEKANNHGGLSGFDTLPINGDLHRTAMRFIEQQGYTFYFTPMQIEVITKEEGESRDKKNLEKLVNQ